MDKITLKKIIIRFVNRKKKNEIQKKCKNLRGINVFINDHLTKRNEELAYLARKLKKEGKISSIWTRNCKIYIKTNGSPEVAKIHHIAIQSDFSRFN